MTGKRKRIVLGGVVAAVTAGALVVVQNSFAATIPGAGPRAGTRAAAACGDVRIIVTRASTEAPGTGIIGSLATAVTRASKQTVTTEATDYPALLNPYPPSVAAGTRALTKQLTDTATGCPATKLVLMGYSQGAHVIGDVLAGTGQVAGFTRADAIGTEIADRVVAVILMGDPRFVPGKVFNAGTSRTRGLFPRGADASLDAFADRTRSFCDTGDTFCAGGQSVAVHLSYTRKYNREAGAFVLNRIGG
ncbi:cutinase family protein [Actinoplanes oblitus]|uniref:Cutinase family protein n=1 Tax=Actinoplanes oblitus TaxID=3040509 RepID=A0ABY8WAP8_9ACTN|nr:cutinase family protein [Actinoplanes oblitus]WIM92790.1 cutinase family protein [Actinoplanes oblitus]